MSVCLSDYNVPKPRHRKFIFAHPMSLHAIGVKFVLEGHRVKVKVTGAENVQNAYSCNVNFDRHNSGSVTDRAMMFACSMGFRLIERCDRHCYNVTGSDHG